VSPRLSLGAGAVLGLAATAYAAVDRYLGWPEVPIRIHVAALVAAGVAVAAGLVGRLLDRGVELGRELERVRAEHDETAPVVQLAEQHRSRVSP